MRVLRTILDELLGLFVADWTQTGITLGLLVAAWFTSRANPPAAAAILVVGLVAQLVGNSLAEARRRSATP